MIAYYPDLEDLLVMPAADEANSAAAEEEKVIRRQLRSTIHRLANKRGAAYALALEATDLLERGERYFEGPEWQKALAVYESVIRELIDHHDLVEDAEGELRQVIYRANNWISRYLASVTNPDFRQKALRLLFDTYRWDVEIGGTDLGPEILDLILRYVTRTEQETVIQWLYTALPTGESWRDNFRRRIYSEGIAKLQTL
jgi:hypothetical protein